MKVAMLNTPDACGYYRCLAPGAAAQQAGVDVSFDARLSGKTSERDGRSTVIAVDPIDADVVVFQRPLMRLFADLIPHLRRMGIAVVVEVDDDLHAFTSESPSLNALLNPPSNPDVNVDHLMRACKEADVVTVSTPALTRRYGCGHCRLIRNAVPDEFCEPKRPVTDGKTVGWLGVMRFHENDLPIVGPGVRDALEVTGGRFHVVGESDGVREALSLREEPSSTGLLDLSAVQPALRGIDVGIAPLAPSMSNRAKSALKPIEYAAASIPSVVSPTPEYERLASQGGCVIARTPEEWRDRIRELLDDPDRAREIGDSNREVVRQHCVISKTVGRWIDAWEAAVKAISTRRRKASTSTGGVTAPVRLSDLSR